MEIITNFYKELNLELDFVRITPEDIQVIFDAWDKIYYKALHKTNLIISINDIINELPEKTRNNLRFEYSHNIKLVKLSQCKIIAIIILGFYPDTFEMLDLKFRSSHWFFLGHRNTLVKLLKDNPEFFIIDSSPIFNSVDNIVNAEYNIVY